MFCFSLSNVDDQAPVTEAMLAVGSASQLEFCTRAAAVEVLLTLAEGVPAIMRKCPFVAPGLLPLAFVLACEVIISSCLLATPAPSCHHIVPCTAGCQT